jgi:hypothetical protein
VFVPGVSVATPSVMVMDSSACPSSVQTTGVDAIEGSETVNVFCKPAVTLPVNAKVTCDPGESWMPVTFMLPLPDAGGHVSVELQLAVHVTPVSAAGKLSTKLVDVDAVDPVLVTVIPIVALVGVGGGNVVVVSVDDPTTMLTAAVAVSESAAMLAATAVRRKWMVIGVIREA